jgi:hypothetical protein
MMLLGARRSARAVTCHVNLVDCVKATCKVTCNEAGEARGCGGADDETGLCGNTQQGAHVGDVVAHRNDVTSCAGEFLNGTNVGDGAGNDDRLTRANPLLVTHHDPPLQSRG